MITYHTNKNITVTEFKSILERSTLAERRPINDKACLQAMLDHANLLCTAWNGSLLVGIARSVTDFAYCCYLSDLAIDAAFQRQGIGRELIGQTQKCLGPQCKIILLAAPKAQEYYSRIGFTQHPSAWILPASDPLR